MVSSTYQTFESWAAMSLLMMTGNYLDYTSIQPVH
jgi:hypothetical protein